MCTCSPRGCSSGRGCMPYYYGLCSVWITAREAWPPKREETFSTFVAKIILTKPSSEKLICLKEMAMCERCIYMYMQTTAVNQNIRYYLLSLGYGFKKKKTRTLYGRPISVNSESEHVKDNVTAGCRGKAYSRPLVKPRYFIFA